MSKRRKSNAKPNRSKIGKKSKRKGDNFERNLSNDLQKAYGTPGASTGDREFYRTPLSGGMKTEYPGDVVVPNWFPFMIEAKKRESIGDLSTVFSRKGRHPVLRWFLEEQPKAQKLRRDLLLVFAHNYGSKLCCVATSCYELLGNSKNTSFTDCLFRVCVEGVEVSIFLWEDFLTLSKADLQAFATASRVQAALREQLVGPVVPLPPSSPK